MAGPTTIDWGDGSPVEDGPEQGTATHTYTTDGPQTATVCDAANPDACTTVEFTIPFPVDPVPEVTAAPDDADASGRTVAITLTGYPADGAVTVDWGDGTPATTLPAGTTTATHPYAAGVEGPQTITATSVTEPGKTATTTFTPQPPTPTPSATATADPADGMTADLSWTDFPAGTTTVTVDWGDGTPPEADLATTSGSGTAPHTYAAGTAGTEQTITVTSDQDTTVTATTVFTPEAPPTTPTATATPDATDPMTAALSWADFPAATTSVTVDWGDGTAVEAGQATADGAGTAQHVYAAGTAGVEQTITVTSEQDATQTATTAFTPEAPAVEPQVTAEPDAGDATGYTANITLTDFPAGSAVSVDWGDGTAAEEIPAGTTTGSHVYDTAVTGAQTITATSVGDATQTASTTFTPGGAALRPAATRKRK